MAPQSAGVLLYRLTDTGLEVLLVHPGGPFWRNKQIGAWQLPKGLIEAGEAPETAARREVEEELGIAISGTLLPLGSIRQAGGKIVHAFACEGTFDPADLRSQTFDLEWPPRSGRQMRFPEIDAARWMPLSEASDWILPSQRPVLGRLEQTLAL
ncbi:NUDIX domain-containing protein [Sphingomonas koreensis]|jgi:predicted NUDIX family NTP pyrophosphohydrolase|uniref:NUDIX domain-containing protein n=1 Tax=Sphingomonas koreensis TaxID=93064 RepID=A0A1L6JDH1_9SPHN|nr:NUDIX domain-containing protein [Sphingomonas koreensis]APR53969.1 NUDIX hydrolase [Sphingomonas koreensis]MDC7808928.1 NUDIX domain-containing protein [Sphingomonas koreensis]RSU19038.1 NUDIX domain-containing protein [Sphingomonas koreensis]RSU24114.1 NUDIX domain-containing protein [Sphingomonas koreensis]RSU26364.1 NUDIX domain-containing protein [Sphingomonas koreensis]